MGYLPFGVPVPSDDDMARWQDMWAKHEEDEPPSRPWPQLDEILKRLGVD